MTSEKLTEALRVIDDDPDATNRLCIEVLNEEPDNPKALFLMATVLLRAERFGLAYNILKRCEAMASRPEILNNLGMALEGMHHDAEARKCFIKAYEGDKKTANYPANVAMTWLQESRFDKAIEWSDKALRLDPEHHGAWTSKGFASLAKGNWKDGWRGYRYCLGGKFRKKIQYGEEPEWDGSKGKHLVVYGEQGLGDEIMYASCLNEAIADAASTVVECDKRLEGLFSRSFPNATVYGTRREDAIAWPAHHQIDCSTPIGGLPEFYRQTDESFNGQSYLVADPERRLQWRALFKSFGKKPKIGICWSGGRHITGAAWRDMGIEAFAPLFKRWDADWFSLQYKTPDLKGFNVRHYKRAVQSDDYDDTAAFVAELDLVIGVHTTVHHLAGALGVPAIVLVPQKRTWVYAREDIPWYGASKLFHQKDGETWLQTMERFCDSDLCRL